MNKKGKLIISIIIITCSVVLVWSAYNLYNYISNYNDSVDTYQQAQSAIKIEPIPEQTENTSPTIDNTEHVTQPTITEIDQYKDLKIKINVDWNQLCSQSNDVIGWLYIPDTNINYPIVQRDNTFYLDHDYQGNYNASGAIFLDRSGSFDAKNIIIYGHHMKADIMFHRLTNYNQQSFAESHQYIYITTPNETRIYQVFATVYAEGTSDTYTWEFDSDSKISFCDYIQKAYKNSLVQLDTEKIVESDNILSLSTCSGRSSTERFVVHAVLISSY